MDFARINRQHGLMALLLLAVSAVLLTACGVENEQRPATGRSDFPQPTFVSLEVTPAPVDPTPTPWPNQSAKGVRQIPEGLDPEFYSRADSDEIVALWTQFLTGSKFAATSGRFHFRNRQRFEGELHLCPGGTGFLAGDPEGPIKWRVNPSAGYWYEVTLSHEIPFTGDTVTFAIGVNDGKPGRSGNSNSIEFMNSDRCALSDASILYNFTADERKLAEKTELVASQIDAIPWIDGMREFPSEITVEGSTGLDNLVGVEYWNAYLSGGAIDAVAYDYSAYAVTEAFTGTLHLCDERVAVLNGDPSGIGEWAVQATGLYPYNAKIVFTLPGDPTFRTLVLGVDVDSPVRMGRDADTGLIGATPLLVRESAECG